MVSKVIAVVFVLFLGSGQLFAGAADIACKGKPVQVLTGVVMDNAYEVSQGLKKDTFDLFGKIRDVTPSGGCDIGEVKTGECIVAVFNTSNVADARDLDWQCADVKSGEENIKARSNNAFRAGALRPHCSAGVKVANFDCAEAGEDLGTRDGLLFESEKAKGHQVKLYCAHPGINEFDQWNGRKQECILYDKAANAKVLSFNTTQSGRASPKGSIHGGNSDKPGASNPLGGALIKGLFKK